MIEALAYLVLGAVALAGAWVVLVILAGLIDYLAFVRPRRNRP